MATCGNRAGRPAERRLPDAASPPVAAADAATEHDPRLAIEHETVTGRAIVRAGDGDVATLLGGRPGQLGAAFARLALGEAHDAVVAMPVIRDWLSGGDAPGPWPLRLHFAAAELAGVTVMVPRDAVSNIERVWGPSARASLRSALRG